MFVNCKVLTKSLLLAVAQPQASLIPLEETLPPPVLPTPLEDQPGGFTKLWSPQVALLFKVYRAFCCTARPHLRLPVASCLIYFPFTGLGERQLSS